MARLREDCTPARCGEKKGKALFWELSMSGEDSFAAQVNGGAVP